jgi:hypothetical protein
MNNLTLMDRRSLLSLLTVAGSVGMTPRLASQQAAPRRMLLCGGNAVYDAALRMAGGSLQWDDVRAWRPERSPGLPASYALAPFATTDDCKLIDNGESVLVTSSAGGVAIFRRDSHQTTFYAKAPNAHSACLLPDGHLAVAASTHQEGNAVLLFHRGQPERELFRVPLYSAHGVEWDEVRGVLYALGMDTVDEYAFDASQKEFPLRKLQASRLPSRGGHELSPGASDDELFVSTGTQVLVFRKDTRDLTPHPTLGAMPHVKSISLHRQSGQLAYVRADEGVWWTFDLRFLSPEGVVQSPGQRLYKARWV